MQQLGNYFYYFKMTLISSEQAVDSLSYADAVNI